MNNEPEYDNTNISSEEVAQMYSDMQKFYNPHLTDRYKAIYNSVINKKGYDETKAHIEAISKLIEENNLHLFRLLEPRLVIKLPS
jgi:hypothetical protein